MSERPREGKMPRWYFGGIASTCAVCFTHPLELIKVFLMTGGTGKLSIFQTVANVIKQDGFLRLYNGISASILHELTYSTARFSLFAMGKKLLPPDAGFGSKILLAGFSGAAGGAFGVPPDLINVRMENDMKLPKNQRRNYKHVFDGMIRVSREEGVCKLFAGCGPAFAKGAMITIGQIACYEEIKITLIKYCGLKDDTRTHFFSALTAGGIATTLTQPLDVIKTRSMNAKPGEYKNLWDVARRTAKGGPSVFYKGFIPAFIRLGPQTIITFIGLEYLRLNLGYFPEE